jgi:FkbM family methyltransferase
MEYLKSKMNIGAYNIVRAAVKFLLLRLIGIYLRIFPSDRLFDHVKDIETNLRRGLDQRGRVSALLGERKLVLLDIGARGGLNKFLAYYGVFFSPVLVEPDLEEAKRLKAQGAYVIDKVMAGAEGLKQFYITKKGGLCSLLKPCGSFLPYYKGTSDRFDVVKTIDVEATTIEQMSHSLGISIDLLKIDVQGAELQILKGIGAVRPLAIISEMSFVELYKDQDSLFELGAYLRGLGYIPFELNFQYTYPPLIRKNRKSMYFTGLPVHGDVCFIPDWTTKIGLDIIKNNPLGWASILIMYGLEDVLQYVVSSVEIGSNDVIDRVLKTKPIKRCGQNIYERVSY